MNTCKHCSHSNSYFRTECYRCGKPLKRFCLLDAMDCSIVGYRLENRTDKAELYFLPGRPAQKTLDQMADLISDGWMVSKIIYSDSASTEARQ